MAGCPWSRCPWTSVLPFLRSAFCPFCDKKHRFLRCFSFCGLLPFLRAFRLSFRRFSSLKPLSGFLVYEDYLKITSHSFRYLFDPIGGIRSTAESKSDILPCLIRPVCDIPHSHALACSYELYLFFDGHTHFRYLPMGIIHFSSVALQAQIFT